MRSSVFCKLLIVWTSIALPAWTEAPGTFTAIGGMRTARIFHTATLLADGRVLVAGGDRRFQGDSDSGGPVEIYDPLTRTFTAIGRLNVYRSGHTATLLPDGKVLLAGSVSASAEMFDPVTGTFSITGEMTEPRTYHTATLLNDGTVLLAGGSFPDGTAEIYNPGTGRFTPTGSLVRNSYGLSQLSNHNAILLPDGRVLLTDGVTTNHPANDAVTVPSSQIYDPATGAFSPTPHMLEKGFLGQGAAALPNGKILIAGAAGYNWWSAESGLFDPVTGLASASGPMSTQRSGVRGVLLTDGTVLVAGGDCCHSPHAERYDPAAGVFIPTGEMTQLRRLFTATLLRDATVLLTGGYVLASNTQSSIVNSAELFIPPVTTNPPALLTAPGTASRQGAILHGATHQVVSSANPARAGEALEIFLTGLMEGSVIPPQISIGGRLAEVLYFGSAPGLANINQINVRVPTGVAPGPAVPVRLTYLGRPSNEVTIAVQ